MDKSYIYTASSIIEHENSLKQQAVDNERMREMLSSIVFNCENGETDDVSYHDRLRIILGLAKHGLDGTVRGAR